MRLTFPKKYSKKIFSMVIVSCIVISFSAISSAVYEITDYALNKNTTTTKTTGIFNSNSIPWIKTQEGAEPSDEYFTDDQYKSIISTLFESSEPTKTKFGIDGALNVISSETHSIFFRGLQYSVATVLRLGDDKVCHVFNNIWATNYADIKETFSVLFQFIAKLVNYVLFQVGYNYQTIFDALNALFAYSSTKHINIPNLLTTQLESIFTQSKTSALNYMYTFFNTHIKSLNKYLKPDIGTDRSFFNSIFSPLITKVISDVPKTLFANMDISHIKRLDKTEAETILKNIPFMYYTLSNDLYNWIQNSIFQNYLESGRSVQSLYKVAGVPSALKWCCSWNFNKGYIWIKQNSHVNTDAQTNIYNLTINELNKIFNS